jgi:hypothetical protein
MTEAANCRGEKTCNLRLPLHSRMALAYWQFAMKWPLWALQSTLGEDDDDHRVVPGL